MLLEQLMKLWKNRDSAKIIKWVMASTYSRIKLTHFRSTRQVSIYDLKGLGCVRSTAVL
jgi:hypothetical protein